MVVRFVVVDVLSVLLCACVCLMFLGAVCELMCDSVHWFMRGCCDCVFA